MAYDFIGIALLISSVRNYVIIFLAWRKRIFETQVKDALILLQHTIKTDAYKYVTIDTGLNERLARAGLPPRLVAAFKITAALAAYNGIAAFILHKFDMLDKPRYVNAFYFSFTTGTTLSLRQSRQGK